MQFMASSHFAHSAFSSPSPQRDYCCSSSSSSSSSNYINTCKFKNQAPSVLLSSFNDRRPSYNNTLVFEAVRLLGPPARFEASKLKVVFSEKETDAYNRIVPRTYTLSHCDFTANLTLTISNIINIDQLRGWYSKDDVVAEWTEVKGNLFLDVHCYVSGPNFLPELAAEFRYHIFSKELPLVLEAVLHGDSVLFKENQELMDAIVRVYFHSSSKKYNRLECWGPLTEAIQGRREDQKHGFLPTGNKDSQRQEFWGSPKSIFQALFAFLL